MEFLFILKRVAVICVDERLTRPSYLSKMALIFNLSAGLMGVSSLRTFMRAWGLACNEGDSFIFLDFFRARTSWIMVKMVRTSRKPEARLCLVTLSAVS